MKIDQEKYFKPITIVLETADEANLFWHLVNVYSIPDGPLSEMAIKISNWFSSEAQIGP